MDEDKWLVDISDIVYNVNSADTITINAASLTEDKWLMDIGDIIYDVNWADTITINTASPVEFEDYMPTVAKIEDMCKEYPGLEKAYENFKSVYRIVEPDWQHRQLKKK